MKQKYKFWNYLNSLHWISSCPDLRLQECYNYPQLEYVRFICKSIPNPQIVQSQPDTDMWIRTPGTLQGEPSIWHPAFAKGKITLRRNGFFVVVCSLNYGRIFWLFSLMLWRDPFPRKGCGTDRCSIVVLTGEARVIPQVGWDCINRSKMGCQKLLNHFSMFFIFPFV